ncbi:MAG: hypothetical protein GY739_22045 [Mesoflavibacter sp.]|nr:hypothetical protein [Mesoflavibacter sp.]
MRNLSMTTTTTTTTTTTATTTTTGGAQWQKYFGGEKERGRTTMTKKTRARPIAKGEGEARPFHLTC